MITTFEVAFIGGSRHGTSEVLSDPLEPVFKVLKNGSTCEQIQPSTYFEYHLQWVNTTPYYVLREMVVLNPLLMQFRDAAMAHAERANKARRELAGLGDGG